eukprot:Filipodium_phascolosomae@DN4826_c0_g1_i1.p1
MWIHKLTPWATWEEYTRVYNMLSSARLADKQLAIEEVKRWTLRCGSSSVPLYVDSTGRLMEAMLRDESMVTSTDQHNGAAYAFLQELYAFSIIRVVSGLLDPVMAQRNLSYQHEAADELELPKWLVQVRNDCTHRDIPTLATLRLAAKQAMLFVQSTYWAPQVEDISEHYFKSGYTEKTRHALWQLMEVNRRWKEDLANIHRLYNQQNDSVGDNSLGTEKRPKKRRRTSVNWLEMTHR